MSEEELSFLEWAAKITEKCTFILLKIKDHIDLSEEEWEYLRYEFGKWHRGEYPLYQTKMDGSNEQTCQNTLNFDNNTDRVADVS